MRIGGRHGTVDSSLFRDLDSLLAQSPPLRFLNLLPGVRINLQGIPGEVGAIEEEPDHKNGCYDHENQKPFHRTV
jgi:hypothetical protein